MKKNKTQVALATVSVALAIHGQLAHADGPAAAYEPPSRTTLDPADYKVNADGAREDPQHPMSDVARAYRNGYINRGKADDERMKQALAAQRAADMAELQRSHDSLGYPSELPPPPPGTIAVPPPGFAGVPPDYVPPQPPGYAAPPAVVQQIYAPPVQYVPSYPYAGYASAQPTIVIGAGWGGYSGYRGYGYGGWGGGWGRGRWH